MNEKLIRNPIIPGFYPDPTICRVDDDFYIVNSSFDLFPGLPIFHSKDLANWTKIANAIDRPEQCYLLGESFSNGIMAPTIRYHEGLFYIIVCNIDDGGNIILTAEDPAGPWSNPVHLGDDIPGIDASLFFDDDGKCYITGLGGFDDEGNLSNAPHGTESNESRGIWLCEFDIKEMRVLGKKKKIWNSALRNAATPEAPHIYRRGDWYYLVIAEGGTGHFHAATVARSKELFGFYHGFEANPVMTHRHLGKEYPIGNIGHADLVELKDGSWYAVLLGSRLFEGFHKNLGRETYLCPVTWEDDWPMFSLGTGKMEWTYPAPDSLPWTPVKKEAAFDDFDDEKLAPFWCLMGTMKTDYWSLHDSSLELKLLPRKITRPGTPYWELFTRTERPDPEETQLSIVARRQESISFDFSAGIKFTPEKSGEVAGLVVMQSFGRMLRIDYTMENDERVLKAVLVTSTTSGEMFSPSFKTIISEKLLASIPWVESETVLKIEERGQNVSFSYGKSNDAMSVLYENADVREINVGGLDGTMLGIYASSNGDKSENSVLIDWSDYTEMQ